MTEIKNQTGTKKKLLIPVVVLMLLGVSLAGAAYAYSSTVTVNDNKLDSQSISIDLTGGSVVTTGVNANYIAESGVVTFEDHFAYTATPAKTNVVKVSAKDMLVLTVKVSISGDAACNKIKVSSSDIDTYLGQVIGNNGTSNVTIGDVFSLKVNNTDAIGTAKTLTDDGADAEFTVSRAADTADPTNVTLYIYVDAVSGDSQAVTGTLTYGQAGWKVASEFATTFLTYNFDLTVEATYDA